MCKALVALQSKAQFCGHSLAGIAGSNPSGGMDVCLMLCVVNCAFETGGSLVHGSYMECVCVFVCVCVSHGVW